MRATSAVGSGQGVGKGRAARTRQDGRLGLGVRWVEGWKNYVNFGDSQRWLESCLPGGRGPTPTAHAPSPLPHTQRVPRMGLFETAHDFPLGAELEREFSG